MRLEVLSFTRQGQALGERLAQKLTEQGETVAAACSKDGVSLKEWTARHFPAADGLIYIGAAAIAVRAIAPHLQSKTTDPAVLCLDEGGRFVIPLLSGHIGGANRLAQRIAGLLGATPVITTATDLRGLFAVDSWAAEAGYRIENPRKIKAVSGKLLAGEPVYLDSEFPVKGTLPAGVLLAEGRPADVWIGCHPPKDTQALWLIPPVLYAGMGCRKGVARECLEEALQEALAQENLSPKALAAIATIDRKAQEPGLLALCEGWKLPLLSYPAAELEQLSGEFSASPFVRQTVGVDNVCERSAVRASSGRLLVKKQAKNGVTAALAIAPCQVRF